MFRIVSLFSAIALSLIVMSCGAGGAADQLDGEATNDNATHATSYVTMPDNTAISVTLVDSIDTDEQQSGDHFRARLNQPVIVDGHTLFADGAAARGVLNKVVESGRLKTPAELNFSLTSVQGDNGDWVDVGTDVIVDKKGSHTAREVAMIGGGAIVGGVIGKIIDRKGSTEIGAAAGAVAGTGLAAATGKQDIFYGPGTEVTFFSNRSMRIALE